jgi:serine/threonine protein kinase
MRCLTWYPEKRATAQELLEHPWLTQPRAEHVKMSDEDYEEMMAGVKEREQKRKLAEALLKPEEKESFSECGESDEERNAADVESDCSEDSDRSLGPAPRERPVNLFAGGYGKGRALTNSFEGPYANMDHIHHDRGANPQFAEFNQGV